MPQRKTKLKRFLVRTGRSLCAASLLTTFTGCKLLATRPVPPEPEQLPVVAQGPPATPGKNAIRLSQYVFYCDFDLKQDSPLFQELGELREQVYKELQLPPANNVIQVFLFEDFDKYRAYMKSRYPELPPRRAFFIAQPRSAGGSEELLVYTYWGPHVQQDLRHELTHALLHSVLKEVPLWLDEGLAEYFELSPSQRGINRAHLEELRKTPLQPNLARLERLNIVDDMKQPEYREAWAWVHLMLRSDPQARKVLIAYLHQLRQTPGPGPLVPKLTEVFPELNDALATHLTKIPMPAATTTSSVVGR